MSMRRKARLVRFYPGDDQQLSGIPSIVFGLFGMALFVNYMGFGDSILAGSLTLGLLCVPLVIRTTEEALKAIPDSMREGSRALGATKLQTIWHVIFADGYAEHYHWVDSRLGTCFGRDGADSVYLCRIFPAATSYRHFGSVYGVALSFVCDFHQWNGYGGTTAAGLWHGIGIDYDFILLVNLLANALRKYFEKRVKTN